jgi:hypothetical protein
LRVHDPGAVAIDVDTPSGRGRVLPQGRTPLEVPIVKTSPPYEAGAAHALSVVRDEEGAITIRCPACYRDHPLVVMPEDGRLPGDKPSNNTLSLEGLKYSYEGAWLLVHVPLLYQEHGKAARPTATVDLATPRSNVEEFARSRPGRGFDLGFLVLMGGLGALGTVGGGVLMVDGIRAGKAWVSLLGIPLAALGVLALRLGIIESIPYPTIHVDLLEGAPTR